LFLETRGTLEREGERERERERERLFFITGGHLEIGFKHLDVSPSFIFVLVTPLMGN